MLTVSKLAASVQPSATIAAGAKARQMKAAGITVGNLMINLSNDILYGKTGNKRDEDIEKIKASIIASGVIGLPSR